MGFHHSFSARLWWSHRSLPANQPFDRLCCLLDSTAWDDNGNTDVQVGTGTLPLNDGVYLGLSSHLMLEPTIAPKPDIFHLDIFALVDTFYCLKFLNPSLRSRILILTLHITSGNLPHHHHGNHLTSGEAQFHKTQPSFCLALNSGTERYNCHFQ